MIKTHGQGPVLDVDFRHVRAATPTPEVLEAIAHARAIIIGPSNPIISIGPILAVPGPGRRDQLELGAGRGGQSAGRRQGPEGTDRRSSCAGPGGHSAATGSPPPMRD